MTLTKVTNDGAAAIHLDETNGRVGIGTSSPNKKLVIEKSNAGGDVGLRIHNNTGTDAGTTASIRFTTSPTATYDTAAIIADRASGSLSFCEGGVEAMRIDSSGNLLVGTTTSNGKMSVEIDTDKVISFNGSQGEVGNVPAILASNSAGSALASMGFRATDLRFATGSAERMRIDSSGKVGIGTSNPTALLELQSGEPRLCLYGTTDNSEKGIEFEHNGSRRGSLFQNNASGQMILSSGDNGNGYSIVFKTDASERMRITNGGNVGIGTTNPVQQSGHGIHINNSSGQSRIKLSSHGTPTANNGFDIIYETNNEVHLLNHETAALKFGTNDAERMRIEDSGNVFIGHSTPTANTNRLLQLGGTNRSATYLEIRNHPDGDGGLVFSDGTTADNSGYRGTVEYSHNGDYMSWRTAGVHRWKLTGGGAFKLIPNSNIDCIYASVNATGTSATVFRGLHSGTTGTPGSGTDSSYIFANGNMQNTNNSYGQISDIKLKENIVDAGSQWDDFKAVRFRKYNFKEETGHETHTQLGVIAQELELTSPGLVYETVDKDSDGKDLGTTTKAVKSTILTQKALVALQEAMARIETLETKVAALEAA